MWHKHIISNITCTRIYQKILNWYICWIKCIMLFESYWLNAQDQTTDDALHKLTGNQIHRWWYYDYPDVFTNQECQAITIKLMIP